MDNFGILLVALLVGAALGAAVAWFVLRRTTDAAAGVEAERLRAEAQGARTRGAKGRTRGHHSTPRMKRAAQKARVVATAKAMIAIEPALASASLKPLPMSQKAWRTL